MWLSADQYDKGLDAWPDLGEDALVNGPDGRVTHAEYCRELEQRLHDAAEVGMTRSRIVPMNVAAFTAWCAETDRQPGQDTRAEYAAQLSQRRIPGLIAWPPGRNDPCWCGSGGKYKKCCLAPR